jgi:hypothetical protein
MSTLIENLTRRINGWSTSTINQSSNNTVQTIGIPATITTTGSITTGSTQFIPLNLTVTNYPSTTSNILFRPEKYYNFENINIDVLRKFIVNEISFVDDLIEIDDSNTHSCKIILSVNKEIYGELEVEYIFDKVEDYIKEKISGLISCMDPDFDQGRMNIMFIPKSTLLDVINNDNKE